MLALDSRFRFLKDKILLMRVWYKDDLQLFHELKDMVQQKMDVYASICEYKIRKLADDPFGPSLMALESKIVAECATRQDHATVRAVRVDDESRREVSRLFEIQKAGLGRVGPAAIRRNGSENGVMHAKALNEEVFVTQLAIRSQAIDSEFQGHVQSILETHALKTLLKSDQKSVYDCTFKDGMHAGVSLYRAPAKSRERMREKVLEYMPDDFPEWPLMGYILDPVRCSVVVQTPKHILEVLSWFQDPACGVTVCKIKNRYARHAKVLDGYRDLSVHVHFKGQNNLSIIGEIQMHLREFWSLKKQMHKLYQLKRAKTPDAV